MSNLLEEDLVVQGRYGIDNNIP